MAPQDDADGDEAPDDDTDEGGDGDFTPGGNATFPFGDVYKRQGGHTACDEIGLPVTATGGVVPCGATAWWLSLIHILRKPCRSTMVYTPCVWHSPGGSWSICCCP